MFLKKIEINGFKSFAQKTILKFAGGNGLLKEAFSTDKKRIAAIVGPNGSGKSNVADALKWVLGEQSMKSLRGKKSSDIIFAGSGTKARLGSAQVAIFLDNSDKSVPIDYQEIVISRKIYQSGESEYLINGSKVRLGDVLELLAKAGVGQRSYSIIDQGMADRLLNATPIERRVIIEEAAGVKEYQIKKEKSQRKLKATVKNLQRAQDLLSEIEPHLRLLKRQYNKAQKGEIYLEELKEKQKSLYSFLWGELLIGKNKFLKKKKEIEEKIALVQGNINQLSAKIRKESGNTVSYKDEISKLEKEKRDLYSRLNDLERGLVVKEGQLELERERLKRVQKKETVVVDTSLIKRTLEKIKIKQNKLVKKITSLKDLDGVVKLKNYALEVIDDIQNLYEAVIRGRVEKNRPKEEIARQEKVNNDRITKLTQLIQEERAKRDEVNRQIGELADKIDALIEKENDERRALIEMEDRLRKERFEVDKLNVELNGYQIELAKLEVKEDDLRKQIVLEMKNDPEKLSLEKVSEVDVSEYSDRIYWLKMQLEQIGGIDEEVIKEYRETQERYDFLVKESKDLREAMKKLEEVIKEMDKQIKVRFADAYKFINKEFKEYFKIIFNGGTAKLEKIEIETKVAKNREEGDDDSIDEDGEEKKEVQVGVEIIASPPGKKIANVGMLSGGERTLTSLALLFSIISYNPPPFALLDEVEAALDEANSRRFGKILTELADKTQFILITHNRQVMKEADVIYGVTMRGDGVSELLSIQLEGAEKYAE